MGSCLQAQEYREALLDAVVELDDAAMEAYLDVRAPTPLTMIQT